MTIFTIHGSSLNDVLFINGITYPGPYTGYSVHAGDGDDIVFLDDAIPATVDGGNGNDFISGGAADDRIFGGKGNDTLNGGAGNDTIFGGHGSDTIYGGEGDDFIFGSKGNNDLFGGAGNDTVNTGDHTSSADGGAGDDLIVARMKKGGDHELTGGTGADTFEFVFQSNKKSADVVITDFELGQDEFVVAGQNGQDWIDDQISGLDFIFDLEFLSQVDGDAVLDIGSNDTITFEGVSEFEFMAYYADFFIEIG